MMTTDFGRVLPRPATGPGVGRVAALSPGSKLAVAELHRGQVPFPPLRLNRYPAWTGSPLEPQLHGLSVVEPGGGEAPR